MMKPITVMALMLLLCSCEIFGWDSAGGNNGDIPINNTQPESGLADLYYIEVPMGYPNSGSETPTETAGGSQITVSGFTKQSRSDVISEENALILTQAACDQTANTILNVSAGATETTVTWQNASLSMGSLTISKDSISTPPLQVITCVN